MTKTLNLHTTSKPPHRISEASLDLGVHRDPKTSKHRQQPSSSGSAAGHKKPVAGPKKTRLKILTFNITNMEDDREDNIRRIIEDSNAHVVMIQEDIMDRIPELSTKHTQLIQCQAEEMLANARRPMFKSVGSGLQDVVVGGMILDHAIQEGLATTLPISFERKLI